LIIRFTAYFLGHPAFLIIIINIIIIIIIITKVYYV